MYVSKTKKTIRRNYKIKICYVMPCDTNLLTSLFIEKDLKLIHGVGVETLLQCSCRCLVRHLSIHKGTSATFLHDLGTIVAGNLAKRFRAIDNWIVDDLSVGQEKTRIRNRVVSTDDVLQEGILRGNESSPSTRHLTSISPYLVF